MSRQWQEYACRLKQQCVTFIFVSGHAGKKGTDRADSLASRATVVDGGAIDHANILNAIGDTG